MRKIYLLTAASLLLGIVFTPFGSPVHAQQSKGGGNAIRVSPVRQDATIKPGTVGSVKVYVTNLAPAQTTFQVVVNDFIASNDETGNPALLLDSKGSETKHGLQQYVGGMPDVTLQPQEEKTINVPITIPANAPGGGYYGAVRFVPKGIDKNSTVSLAASVASLVLVTVPGHVDEQLTLVSLNARQGISASTFFTNGKNLKVDARFKNIGNVQTAPFGKVNISKNGKVIDSQEINPSDPQGTVLPDSIRKFEISAKNTESFGKYVIQGNFGYGKSSQALTQTTTFYVIPWSYIIGLLVLILLIVGIILFWRHSKKVNNLNFKRR